MESVHSILVLALVIHILLCSGQLCSDTDYGLCTMMGKADPNMCDDPCMSKLCRRYCGHCPFLCYSCHEIGDVKNCTNTIQCNSNTELCFTVQTFDDHFQEVYKLGCAEEHTCTQYASISSKSKRVSVDAGCCNQDQCNNKPPALLHIVNTTDAPVTVATRNRSLCENLGDDICKRLQQINPDMCADPCVADNICPHSCGRCYNCLECEEIDHPEKCNTTTECNNGKECFLMEVLTHEFKPAVRLGCIEKDNCKRFHSAVTDVFGRRQEFKLQGRCCVGETCNANMTEAIQLTPTEPPACQELNKGKGCPQGFHMFDGTCYHLGYTALDKVHSRNYCRRRCSNLAEFNTTSDLKQFLVLSHSILSLPNNMDLDMYVGMMDTNLSRDSPNWIWELTKTQMEADMLVRPHTDGNYFCMSAIVHSRSSYVSGLENVDCTRAYQPLCQIKII